MCGAFSTTYYDRSCITTNPTIQSKEFSFFWYFPFPFLVFSPRLVFFRVFFFFFFFSLSLSLSLAQALFSLAHAHFHFLHGRGSLYLCVWHSRATKRNNITSPSFAQCLSSQGSGSDLISKRKSTSRRQRGSERSRGKERKWERKWEMKRERREKERAGAERAAGEDWNLQDKKLGPKFQEKLIPLNAILLLK